ncbi:NDR1/HIN1-like protein 3 [Alnus glutinosa]|uniref:NDR1/HIN1-like protein 3 n=1 Tax=Alnus glutinosa TaxID=3517 RepID=UPI002D781517|nr:NDR1/HIN1-like protein 3 [Alnus glutinosa]
MAEKQSHLNGAYYGPAVPPPTQSYHRHGRGRGCGCCCLFGFLLKLVVSLVVIIGLAALIFWLIFRPTNVKFYVTDASLTEFTFTGNNTLQYNLAVNITVRNPNRKIGVYYDTIEANAYYEDQRFGTKSLTPFYQGHKTTSYLNTAFEGQQLVLLGTDELSQFNAEKTAGVYTIDVKLNLRIRFKVGKVKTGRLKPKVKCDLKVPLSSTGNSAVVFQNTKCDVDF